MNTFIENKGFKNKIDLPLEMLRIQNELYPSLELEKKMESRIEYLEGCRESNIRSLLRQENISDLVDRFFEYAKDKEIQDLKSYLVNVCVENNFIEDEELN